MTEPEGNYDAASKLLTQAKESQTWREWTSACLNSTKSLIHQFKAQKAPVTSILISITAIVFTLRSTLYLYITESFPSGIVIILTQRGALTGLTAYLFVNFPWIAWPLSEFLHKGIGHFISNIALLALFGKIVEPRFQTRHYILWFVGIAIIVEPLDALITLSTSTKTNVAVYGISDFVYSLGFYSALALFTADHRTELEYLGLLIGVTAILEVSLHLVNASLQMSIQPINSAHLLGGLLGIVVFGLVRVQE